MQRVTITLDDDLMADLDRIIAARGYQNRSEAIRDLARSGLEQAAVEAAGSRNCVATLVYVYDHHARELPKRLTQGFHDHHDLSQATLHVHLDHESCLEVTVLKGRGSEVQSFANEVIAERGVRHGHVVYMPAPDGTAHRHAHDHDKDHGYSHGHSQPKISGKRPRKRNV
jgi:CopG family nickel-responsive transcriptional regulator